MEICHKGHDVDFMAYGLGFCDCSSSSMCQLQEKSAAVAATVLRNSSQKTQLSFDSENRIVGTIESGLEMYPFQEFFITSTQNSPEMIKHWC